MSGPAFAITEWLTKEQAARILGCSREWIDRKVRKREIEQRKQPVEGRRAIMLVNPDDIDRLRSQQKTDVVLGPEAVQVERRIAGLLNAPKPPPPTPPKPFMELHAAADWSGLPYRLLLRLIREGRLASAPFDGMHYVARRDLDNLELGVRMVQKASGMKIPGKEWLGEPKEHYEIDLDRRTVDHVLDFQGSQGLPERPFRLRCDYCQQETDRLWCRMVRPHSVQLIDGLRSRGSSTFTGGTWNACVCCESFVSARDLRLLTARAQSFAHCPGEMLRRAYEAVFACFEDAPAIPWKSGDKFPVTDWPEKAPE